MKIVYEPHEQRVITEQHELDVKLEALNEFFESIRFAALDAAEQQRMRTQAIAMKTYRDILGERIQAFRVNASADLLASCGLTATAITSGTVELA